MTDSKKLQQWSRMKAMGRTQYIVRLVLLKAIPLGIFTAAVDLAPFSVHNPFEKPSDFVLIFGFFGLFGVLLGIKNWRSLEYLFEKKGAPRSAPVDDEEQPSPDHPN